MLLRVLYLVLSLAIILVSCELFTNGIEWAGRKLRVGDGVVGSIFSAVGTCLPETMIPVMAILFSSGGNEAVDIGIGAIVGAPFMLSTLAFFITGMSVLLFRKSRVTGLDIRVNSRLLSRDIGFFLIVYTIGVAAAFTNSIYVKYSISVLLAGLYVYYIVLTVRNDKQSHGQLDALYLEGILGLKTGFFTILLQVFISLTGIIIGAHMFVGNLEEISNTLGVSALVLSLIIAPIATELPEKFNSIIWISKNKDTLALGNITGAMVFQSCIPVSIGIAATPWILDGRAVISAVLAMISSLVTYLWLRIKGRLSPVPLLSGIFFYGVFIAFLFKGGLR